MRGRQFPCFSSPPPAPGCTDVYGSLGDLRSCIPVSFSPLGEASPLRLHPGIRPDPGAAAAHPAAAYGRRDGQRYGITRAARPLSGRQFCCANPARSSRPQQAVSLHGVTFVDTIDAFNQPTNQPTNRGSYWVARTRHFPSMLKRNGNHTY